MLRCSTAATLIIFHLWIVYRNLLLLDAFKPLTDLFVCLVILILLLILKLVSAAENKVAFSVQFVTTTNLTHRSVLFHPVKLHQLSLNSEDDLSMHT